MDDRSDLEAAHRRIAELERAIVERSRPRPPPDGPAPVFLASVGLFALLTLIGLSVVALRSRPPPPIPVEQPRPAPVDEPKLSVVPMAWSGPIVADVGGKDATEDFVAVFSRRDGAAELAAIDGATFEPIWRTRMAPFTDARPHTFARRVADQAVVVDRSRVRTFDLLTGAPRGEWTTPVETWELCPFENGEPRAYLEREAFDRGVLLDLAKGTLTEAPKKLDELGCHGRSDMPLCSARKTLPCESSDRRYLGKTLTQAYVVYEDEETIATVGWSKEEGAPYFAVFTDKKTKRTIWEGRLGRPEDLGHEHDFRYAYAGGRVVFTYQTVAPGRVLVAHDVKDGRVAWTQVAGGAGSSMLGLTGTKTRLYVALDDRIVVVDPTTGKTLAQVFDIAAGAP